MPTTNSDRETFTHGDFLGRSAKDKAVVRPLAERLRQDGLRVWFGEWLLKAGDSIPAKIEEGLDHSGVLVLCMSANAFGSDWVQLLMLCEPSPNCRPTEPGAPPHPQTSAFSVQRFPKARTKGSPTQFLRIN